MNNMNYFPYPQANIPARFPNVMQPNMVQSNGIIWVQGMEGAKAYQLAPNSNVMLLDSENNNTFYIKVSDNVGMCTLRVFKYEEMSMQKPEEKQVDMSMYITREEFNKTLASLKGVKNEPNISTNKPKQS